MRHAQDFRKILSKRTGRPIEDFPLIETTRRNTLRLAPEGPREATNTIPRAEIPIKVSTQSAT